MEPARCIEVTPEDDAKGAFTIGLA